MQELERLTWVDGYKQHDRQQVNVWGKWYAMMVAGVYPVRGKLEECGDGKVTYVGGLRKCIVVNEGMEAEEVRRMVIKITFKGDADMRMFFNGNEEHGYLYVSGNDGPTRRGYKAGVENEGRTLSCDHSVVGVASGGNGSLKGNNEETGVKSPVPTAVTGGPSDTDAQVFHVGSDYLKTSPPQASRRQSWLSCRLLLTLLSMSTMHRTTIDCRILCPSPFTSSAIDPPPIGECFRG
ncbi:hypothetical protein Cgig2_033191 [Carnegiea gigantea]|uniref:Uncharacterized protein n=1 Tax=Carnegiea gigantea TaxID=171969 RepID=A0A9Q1GLF1_9CARY|nr:hypothetical protein Cgig2_033191 [Carnegiea gigantea]